MMVTGALLCKSSRYFSSDGYTALSTGFTFCVNLLLKRRVIFTQTVVNAVDMFLTFL